jgi:hypothetical protein
MDIRLLDKNSPIIDQPKSTYRFDFSVQFRALKAALCEALLVLSNNDADFSFAQGADFNDTLTIYQLHSARWGDLGFVRLREVEGDLREILIKPADPPYSIREFFTTAYERYGLPRIFHEVDGELREVILPLEDRPYSGTTGQRRLHAAQQLCGPLAILKEEARVFYDQDRDLAIRMFHRVVEKIVEHIDLDLAERQELVDMTYNNHAEIPASPFLPVATDDAAKETVSNNPPLKPESEELSLAIQQIKSHSQREIGRMYFIDGMTMPQIASAKQMAKGSIGPRITEIRKELRQKGYELPYRKEGVAKNRRRKV